MKFRIRKRKRASSAQTNAVQRPPQVITVNTPAGHNFNNEDRRWALQKLFASHLFSISRKHLRDNPQNLIRRRASLVDASTAGDTTVARPTDPFLDEVIKPKPKPSFRITCGTNNSPARKSHNHNNNIHSAAKDLEHERSTHACLGTERRMGLRCTDRPVEEEPDAKPDNDAQEDAQQCSFWCPLLSFVPDSYSTDLRDSEGLFDGMSHKPCGYYLLANAFRKKADTKRNGIPKVITVVKNSPGSKVKPSCCGTMELVEEDNEGRLKQNYKAQDPLRSFDSSIFRLEEYLMKANLDADVEDKFEKPMDPRGVHDFDRGGTAPASSVTSSISTHSSLKFGASIIHLPAAMREAIETK